MVAWWVAVSALRVVGDLLTATVPEFKRSIATIYSGATPLFWPPEQRPD